MKKPQPAGKPPVDLDQVERFASRAGGASTTSSAETRRLNVNVPAALYDELKAKADSEGRSITWLVTRWIEGYVSNGE